MNELWLLFTALLSNGWKRLLAYNAVIDDSDKTFTVPAGNSWFLTNIHVNYISSADAGNRQLTVLLTDSADAVIAKETASVVQAASATVGYEFNLAGAREAAVVTGMLRGGLPGLVLSAGMKVRVYDSAAIAAAADDMTVALNGLFYQTPPSVS